jgi:hypothetical protein
MKRVVAIAACAFSLTGCSSLPNWMQLDAQKSAPAATTMQLESEPAGAEAKTSLGQVCRTPCTLEVTASEFTVVFALPGYQPQTVPVRAVGDASDPAAARLVPNPIFVELQPGSPAPAAKKPAPAKKTPRPGPRPGPTAMAPEQPTSPAPAPASPWPPPR